MPFRVPLRFVVPAVVLAGAAALVAARWGGRGRDGDRPPGIRPLLVPGVVTVAPGVHLLGRTFPNAAYAVETSAGLVLVDTCRDPDAGQVREQLAELGLDPGRLATILLTHAHGDHTIGAGSLREGSGATVCAGRGDAGVLRAGGPREAFFSVFDIDAEARPVPVDRELDGGEVLQVGGARFRVIATPGHTPGSVCYLLERDSLRILFAGDTVMSLTDADPDQGPGIYPAYFSPRYRGDAAAALASMKALLAMPVPDLVLPGHPRADPDPQSAAVTEERWKALLGRAVERLERLLRRYAEDGADFLDGTPRELLPGLHYLGNAGRFALYARVAADGRLFLFDAPGGEGLPALLEERLRAAGLGGAAPAGVLLTRCGEEATSGLRSLVEATGCAVAAPDAGRTGIRDLCPPGTKVVAAESLPEAGWFPVEVVPVRGRGPAVAYLLPVEGRRALVCGRTPTFGTMATGAEIDRSLSAPGADPAAYDLTLDLLSSLAPDLWLPALPVHEQNAHVYDDQWVRAVETNRVRKGP